MSEGRDWGRRLAVAAVATLAAGLLAGLALAVAGPRAASGHADLVGSPAPGLAGTTLRGTRFRLHAASGHVTLVNIWAAWCTPCRDEIPLLARAAAGFRRRGVRLVTIDTRDGPVAGRALLADAGAQSLVAVSDPRGRLAVIWGATGVPETVVVDGHGIVRARWLGAVSRTWLDREVRRWS